MSPTHLSSALSIPSTCFPGEMGPIRASQTAHQLETRLANTEKTHLRQWQTMDALVTASTCTTG
eukprot:2494718-Rhodomonas_salina.4